MPFRQTPLQKTNKPLIKVNPANCPDGYIPFEARFHLANLANLIAKLNFCLIASVELHEKLSKSCQKITLRLIAQTQIQDKITL